MKNSIIFILLFFCFQATAQKIFLDKYKVVAGVKVFQTVNNPNQYYYLSDQINIGKDKNGKPQVLFLKYSKNVESKALEEDIKEGDGGGIFHALVNFEIPAERIKQAEKALQKENPEATIEGPITYKSGKVALISAIAGTNKKKIIGLGNAPTMEGNKTAVAFRLTKEDAILLWETFKTPVPDISFVFEMEMEGFLSPRKGHIKGSFDKVYSSHEMGVSGGYPVGGIFIGADIGASFEKLRKDGVIEVYQEEGGEGFDEFIKIAYKQLADIIFQRTDAGASQVAALTPQQDPLEKLQKYQQLLGGNNGTNNTTQNNNNTQNNNSVAPKVEQDTTQNDSTNVNLAQKGTKNNNTSSNNGASTAAPQGNNSPVGGEQNQKQSAAAMPAIMATYKYSKIKQNGDFFINFNKVSAAQQFTSFAENIGQINCSSCFREVNLSIAHKAFDQREILYMIDGASESDFTNYINFVNVTFRKKHQSGKMEVDNKRIIRQAYTDNGNLFKMVYGYDKDNDLEQWLEYDYKTTWSFFGGYELEGDWQTATSGTVALKPPLEKRIVKIEADKQKLDKLLVRAIHVRLYDIGGENKPKLLELYREQSGQIEYILPENVNEYEYEITWMLDDDAGTVVESGRKKSAQPLLYADKLPRK
jgi:hypothetical protein